VAQKRSKTTQMRASTLISAVCLATIAAGLSAHVDSAQTSELECTQRSNLPDDGSSLALGLKASGFNKIDHSQAESACRFALRTDPTNSTLLFQLARALFLGDKRLEAMKYYLDAADRGHAGAMNDLGGVFEYGRKSADKVADLTTPSFHPKPAAMSRSDSRRRYLRTLT
jgi:TPR repeat protein